ncbi:hypothetical protein D5S17_11535 [Pseudonocardiaceae bacterium YIM PH 21723]|nr:hypothetical protein D5S17_11535 [Pseudonocardiaceae bacterium YIM PH 21723]
MNSLKKALVAGSVALMVAATMVLGGTAATAEPVTAGLTSQQQAAPEQCGYYTLGPVTARFSFYDHCGDGRVIIKIVYYIGSDEERCVGPGTSNLGLGVSNAYYDRPC